MARSDPTIREDVPRAIRTRPSRKLAALVGILVVPAAVACNGILGISDYEKGDCTGGCPDADLPDTLRPDAAKADRDEPAPVDPGPGTQPVRWAKFKMPNYPDAGVDANIPTYGADTATGTITDTVSGLVWRQKSDLRGVKPYVEAESHCKGLQGGWRLPSRIELVTLLNLARSPKIAEAFSDQEFFAYWTSSEVRPLPADAKDLEYWTVDFNTGGLGRARRDGGSAAVRCIKDATK